MGSGRDPHSARARRVGAWIARAGYHLLTGGGEGVMAEVTEAFVGVPDRPGQAIGILPGIRGGTGGAGPGEAPPGYPNPWVEIAIRTHLGARGARGGDPDSRNHVNVLTSDVVIVLPGGEGTASEARLALRYGRPAGRLPRARRGDVPGLPDADRRRDALRPRAVLRPRRVPPAGCRAAPSRVDGPAPPAAGAPPRAPRH